MKNIGVKYCSLLTPSFGKDLFACIFFKVFHKLDTVASTAFATSLIILSEYYDLDTESMNDA